MANIVEGLFLFSLGVLASTPLNQPLTYFISALEALLMGPRYFTDKPRVSELQANTLPIQPNIALIWP